MKIGDRYQHISGSIWKIKQIHPNSVMMSIGADDLVAVKDEELSGYSGQIPYAQMNWQLIK